jgi:hypothetical protein
MAVVVSDVEDWNDSGSEDEIEAGIVPNRSAVVLVPCSLLRHWEEELRVWSSSFKIFTLHSSGVNKSSIVERWWKCAHSPQQKIQAEESVSCYNDCNNDCNPVSLLVIGHALCREMCATVSPIRTMLLKTAVVVFDEFHQLKGQKSRELVTSFKTLRKVGVTATPMENVIYLVCPYF